MSNAFRSGFVSIVGRPNSGKSTLVNQLAGEKVSIVTDRPQTTRHVIKGVLSRPEGQIVFLDTPGIHKPIHRMNERMMELVRQSIGDADVVALLVDASTPFGKGDQFTVELVASAKAPKFLLLNKIDKVAKSSLLAGIAHYSSLAQFEAIIPISALTGDGVELFVTEAIKHLPEGPRYFPDDQPTDRTERAIAEEIIREKLIQATRDELPYATAVVIEAFTEEAALTRIVASILVERDSHKAIVIGKGGQALKAVGTAARQDIEKLIQTKVFLELRVVVRKDWRNNRESLRRLGLE